MTRPLKDSLPAHINHFYDYVLTNVASLTDAYTSNDGRKKVSSQTNNLCLSPNITTPTPFISSSKSLTQYSPNVTSNLESNSTRDFHIKTSGKGPCPKIMARAMSLPTSGSTKARVRGENLHHPHLGPSLPLPIGEIWNKTRTSQLWSKRLDDYHNDDIQPESHEQNLSEDYLIKSEQDVLESTLLSSSNDKSSKRGSNFFEKLWGPPPPSYNTFYPMLISSPPFNENEG